MLNKNNKIILNKNKQCTWPGEGLCYEARETLTLQKMDQRTRRVILQSLSKGKQVRDKENGWIYLPPLRCLCLRSSRHTEGKLSIVVN